MHIDIPCLGLLMATQEQRDKVFLQIAESISTLSHAVRKKVGCVLVTPENVMLSSYNGQPSGWDNRCEYEEMAFRSEFGKGSWFEKTGELVTLNTTIHSELNAILHAARQGVSVKGSTIYITLSPCLSCSAMIAQAGIKRVVFKESYRDTSGIEILKQHGIVVEQLT